MYLLCGCSCGWLWVGFGSCIWFLVLVVCLVVLICGIVVCCFALVCWAGA